MKTVRVNASKEYDVVIGRGLLDRAGEQIRAVLPRAVRAAVISDDNVAPLYLERVLDSLSSAGFESLSFVFPHGEQSKNGRTYLEILGFLASSHITRSDVVIALGGGVVGDITGFAAATFLRGVSYVQLPTSLLAMVDSSVGGKTAIDLEEGKNLAGAFCQPEIVLCDLDTLDTLTPEFFIDGSGIYEIDGVSHPINKNTVRTIIMITAGRAAPIERKVERACLSLGLSVITLWSEP